MLNEPLLVTDEIRARLEVPEGSLHMPDTLPAVRSVLIGPSDEGAVWIEEYLSPYDEDAPITWWIFGQSGELLGRANLPQNFTPKRIVGDRVLGVVLNALDVPFVEIRRITEEP